MSVVPRDAMPSLLAPAGGSTVSTAWYTTGTGRITPSWAGSSVGIRSDTEMDWTCTPMLLLFRQETWIRGGLKGNASDIHRQVATHCPQVTIPVHRRELLMNCSSSYGNSCLQVVETATAPRDILIVRRASVEKRQRPLRRQSGILSHTMQGGFGVGCRLARILVGLQFAAMSDTMAFGAGTGRGHLIVPWTT